MKHTILIVEDDQHINEIITDYLTANNYITYRAYNGIDALSLFEQHTIDLVILDIMLPSLDGWTVCRRIRKQSKETLILMLSARSDEDDQLMGFELGADDYVTKPFSPKVLMAKVTSLLARSRIEPSVISTHSKGLLTINKEEHTVMVAHQSVTLTAKEFDLLLLLFENERKVYKRDVLINALWDYDYIGDGRVVDTNIKTLRRKLGAAANYIHTVIGVGYKFEVTL